MTPHRTFRICFLWVRGYLPIFILNLLKYGVNGHDSVSENLYLAYLPGECTLLWKCVQRQDRHWRITWSIPSSLINCLGKEKEVFINLAIIGGDATGMSAVSRAKRTQPNMNVIVLEKTQDISWSWKGASQHSFHLFLNLLIEMIDDWSLHINEVVILLWVNL